MKYKIFLAVLFFVSVNLFSQSQVESLVRQGMNESYNFQFDAAEKTFNKILQLKPNSPEGYYRISLLHFWIFLGSKDPGEYQTFIKFADLALQKAEKILEKSPKDYQTKYSAANLYSFRAMAQATNNESVDAFWSSKKAVNYFEEVLKQNHRYYDAYLGLGLFDYAMSFVPDFLKWAVNLSGLSSDKARGFKYIKLAYKKGINCKTEAAFHLSKIYTDYLAEHDSAYSLLQELTMKFPNSALFNYQYAVSLIKGKEIDRALPVLDRVIKLNNKKMPQITALAYYRRGEIYFDKNQYRTAIKNYKKFLDTSKELDFTGIASLNIAISYKMLGQEAEFKKYASLAKNGNQDLFEDAYSYKKSEQYSNYGIDKNNLKLVRMKNHLNVGDYKSVYDSLNHYIAKIDDKTSRALAHIYLAEAALNLKKFHEVISICDQLKEERISGEKWILPMAYLLNAKAKFYLGDKTAAKDHLEDASDQNEFDFKDQIQAQIEWLHRKLK